MRKSVQPNIIINTDTKNKHPSFHGRHDDRHVCNSPFACMFCFPNVYRIKFVYKLIGLFGSFAALFRVIDLFYQTGGHIELFDLRSIVGCLGGMSTIRCTR